VLGKMAHRQIDNPRTLSLGSRARWHVETIPGRGGNATANSAHIDLKSQKHIANMSLLAILFFGLLR
jgi:hypothetical protein